MKFLLSNYPWGVVATGFAMMMMMPANAAHHHHPGSYLRSAKGGDGTSVEAEKHSVIGGNYTNGQEFPFFVQAEDLACGGSLVAPDVVLTAAHCAPYWKGSVLVGSNRLNSTAGPAQWRRILGEIYVHPQFNEVKRVHDLAAFRIEPVTLPNLQPVKLNDQPSNPVVSQWVTVAGYGETETPNIQTKYLRKAQLKIFDNDICKATHEYLDPLVADMDMTAMLCASGASSTKRGPSFGDSGGPLMDGNNTLIGLVSWGASEPDEIGVPYIPEVFARVSGHLDWIKPTICKLSSYHANLSFPCLRLVCPPDVTLEWDSTVVLPSALHEIQAPPGFVAVNVTQWPPAGKVLKWGSKTVVTVSARNASSPSPSAAAVVANCQYNVTVPLPKSFKQFNLQLPHGATTTPKRVTLNRSSVPSFVLSGVSAKLSNRNLGRSAVVRVKVFRDSVAVFHFVMRSGEETFGRRTAYIPGSLYSFTPTERWRVEVSSSGLTNAVTLSVDLLGRNLN